MKTAIFSFFVLVLTYSVDTLARDARSGFYLPVDFDLTKLGFKYLEDTGVDYYNAGGKIYHPGIDINKPGTSGNDDRGAPVKSIAKGEVVYVQDTGWMRLVIKHEMEDNTSYSVYGHSELRPTECQTTILGNNISFTKVSVGDTVEGGQQIACIWDHGTEGSAHLHLEVREFDHPNVSGNYFNELANKTVDQVEDIYIHPTEYILYDGYYDGRCHILSSDIAGGGIFCWKAPDGNENINAVSCLEGTAHAHYNKDYKGVISKGWTYDDSAKQTYCGGLVQGPVDLKLYLNNPQYYSGTESGDFGGGDLPGDGTTPWDGYDHDVGLKKVELCKDESDGCKSSLEVSLDDLPRWDIRAKLKRKGGQWKDVDIDYYCSPNRDFGDGDDTYLGNKSKDLADSKYDDKDEKSVYLKNADLNSCINTPGKYYLFVVVNYSGGKNPSTENDGEEHVRLEVQPPPPRLLTPAEIMQVINPIILD